MSFDFDDMMDGGLFDELEDRSEAANMQSDGGVDYDSIRRLNFKVGQANGNYQFLMYLLPYKDEATGRNHIFRTVFSHFGLPTSETDTIIRVCLAMTDKSDGDQCPICNVIQQAISQVPDKKSDFAKTLYRMKAKGQAYFNVLPKKIMGKEVGTDIPWGQNGYDFAAYVARLGEKHANKLAAKLNEMLGPNRDGINPLNPMAAVPVEITVERVGSRSMDIRYNAGFEVAREAPWFPGMTQAHVDSVFDSCYDLNKIHCKPGEEKKSAYRGDAQLVQNVLNHRIAQTFGQVPQVGYTGGVQAPQYDAPPAAPQQQFTPPPAAQVPQAAPPAQAPAPAPPAPAAPTPPVVPPTAPPAPQAAPPAPTVAPPPSVAGPQAPATPPAGPQQTAKVPGAPEMPQMPKMPQMPDFPKG